MEERLVAYAAERDFVALDAMIRRYQTLCDELDGKPPEDKNGFFISQVGNRWVSKGDHDALNGALIKKAIEAAMDPPDPGDPRTAAQRREAAAVRCYRFFLDRGESPTEDGERPHIAITVPVESSVPAASKPPAMSPSPPARSAGCSATRNSKSSSPTPTATRSTSAPPSTVRSRKLRRAVLFRDQGRCRYPGCDRTHGEVHHVIAFPDGKTVIA